MYIHNIHTLYNCTATSPKEDRYPYTEYFSVHTYNTIHSYVLEAVAAVEAVEAAESYFVL